MPRSKSEIGAPGLPLFSGRLSLEANTRLRWPQAGRIYRDMLDNEVTLAALRMAVQTLLRSDIQVKPGGETEADKRAAGHLEQCLGTMDHNLGTYLRQMAGGYFYGFSFLEQVHRRNPDGTVGWRTWGLRRQETLHRWETDKNGQISAFTQRPAPDYGLRTIPLTKALHFVADDSEGSPEGRGVCRGMYRYWFFKQNIEILFGIALERFGTGMPVFERIDNTVVLTATQENEIAAIAASIRQNEEAYALLPWGLKFRFEPSPGLDAANYLSTIQAYSTWMLAAALAEFIALGTGQTGSFALGESKIELFLKAMTGLQDALCEVINRQAIPRLMAYNNFGALTAMPTVSLPAVRNYDLEKLGNFAQVLSGIGAFHPTPQDEQWFRAISDLADMSIEELEDLHEEDEIKEKEEAKRAAEALATGRNQDDSDEIEETEDKELEPIEEE